MGIMEIILLVLGAAVFVLSFLLPAGRKEETQKAQIDEEAIREAVEKEVDQAKSKISDVVEETVTYSMEKAERSMDRLTNEKMLAVNEYSDTVLAEINKNHKEVVFLYDMMNDKQESLKSVVSEATKTASEVKQTVKDAEVTAQEIETKTKEVKETIDQLAKSVAMAEEKENAPVPEAELPRAELPNAEGFKPMEVKQIETVALPDQGAPETAKTKSAGKTPRKPRTSKAAGKTQKAKDKDLALEVAVTLNEEGEAGSRNSNERILELHNAGKSNMAIARELGLGIGEVKLVIDLFEGI